MQNAFKKQVVRIVNVSSKVFLGVARNELSHAHGNAMSFRTGETGKYEDFSDERLEIR